MNVVKARSSRFLGSLPLRLYRALPAVLLGTLINVLDAVSTGILIFPAEDSALRALQLQGLSMFIMSTLTSQLAMTLGGSRFPGGVGAMLIEILPFLRGIVNDIPAALGDGHPGLIPTIMAVYALTSFLTGGMFLILGILKLGNLVAYFPQTVLTGTIGAIGLSLFLLGLELPFPSSAPPLSLSNVSSTLFGKAHLGILAASFFPVFFLSLSLRSRYIEIWTRGLVRSAYYIPMYLLTIPAVFWVAVRALGISKDSLVAGGWLFTVDSAGSSPSGIVASWNYWTLFDFKMVQWWALKNATQNIVLLVVIGVLNLPIYVPTLAFTLDVSYDMNHELLGQAAGNFFAGVVGTLPNLVQYSYSVYVTRAKGGRFELFIVSILTGALFFTSGFLLPYVPTILASALILFIGIELFLEAIWEASKTLAWMEYAIVLGTLAACTFLGFAEGFGVGIGAAGAVYLVYGVIDSPARVTRWAEWNELQQMRSQDEDHVAAPIEGRLPSPRNLTPAPITLDPPRTSGSGSSLHSPPSDVKTYHDTNILREINARVITLSGYIFFASIPSLEKALLNPSSPASFFILDLTNAHRIETAAARVLLRCVRELKLKDSLLVICGVRHGSGLSSDFERAEVGLAFDPPLSGGESAVLGIPTFQTRESCLVWCRSEHENRLQTASKPEGLDDQEMQDIFEKFCALFEFDLARVIETDRDENTVNRFLESGAEISVLLPGQVIHRQGITCITEGEIVVTASSSDSDPVPIALRPSVLRLLAMMPSETVRVLRERFRMPAFLRRTNSPGLVNRLLPGGVVDWRGQLDGIAVAKTRTTVVILTGETLLEWGHQKIARSVDANSP
ncbi:hypothetical protein R3P38DRAFT_3593018 [Favolaschia claudopus]|uniref:STAS domain-containing protein n=1 Tax=Favolaschia claudopus TaxID=2862362 RepID=A0AAW0AGY7_9AGAR